MKEIKISDKYSLVQTILEDGRVHLDIKRKKSFISIKKKLLFRNHPEIKSDEIHLGNMSEETFQKYAHIPSIRKGKEALDRNNKPVKGLFPVFCSVQDHKQAMEG